MKPIHVLFLLLCTQLSVAQQVPDTAYLPVIADPAYPASTGPAIFIDEGHYNFHTKDGRYSSFAKLLERDGYVVKSHSGPITHTGLERAEILVISNALNAINQGAWYLPTPSAFAESEIEAIREWVNAGGSLFLIADHMPFAGAATDLAGVMGFKCTNGFVFDTTSQGPIFFTREMRTLGNNLITNGRSDKETVTRVASFTGHGFTPPDDATSVLAFHEDCVNLMPDTAWVFNNTPFFPAANLSQLAYRQIGNGRVVMSGEAAMFSAQLAGPNQVKVGMNSEGASQNYQLLLNIIHWLDGIL